MYNILNKMVDDGNKGTGRLKEGNKTTIRCTSCNAKIEVEVPEKGKSLIFGCKYCGSTNVLSASSFCDLY